MATHILSADQRTLIIRSDMSILAEDEANDCAKLLKEQTEASLEKVIFDFRLSQMIALPALRILTRAVSGFIQNETKIAVVGQKDVLRFIRDQGLNRIFECHSDMTEIQPEVAPVVQKTKALEFLNTTLEALAYTFKVSTNTEVSAGKAYVRGSGPEPKVEIAAAVGLFSHSFSGSLVLGFPDKTYLAVMSRFIGQEYTEITSDIQDGVAELLNIVLGQAKTALNQKGFALKQAIPTVSRGRNLQVLPAAYNRRSIIVPYTSEIGPFYIELTTGPETKPSSSS